MAIKYKHYSGAVVEVSNGEQTVKFKGRRFGPFPAYDVERTQAALIQHKERYPSLARVADDWAAFNQQGIEVNWEWR